MDSFELEVDLLGVLWYALAWLGLKWLGPRLRLQMEWEQQAAAGRIISYQLEVNFSWVLWFALECFGLYWFGPSLGLLIDFVLASLRAAHPSFYAYLVGPLDVVFMVLERPMTAFMLYKTVRFLLGWWWYSPQTAAAAAAARRRVREHKKRPACPSALG
jgi:hypothetical protein